MSENKKSELNIPEFQLEDLINGFDGHPNHLEWGDITPVGREV